DLRAAHIRRPSLNPNHLDAYVTFGKLGKVDGQAGISFLYADVEENEGQERSLLAGGDSVLDQERTDAREGHVQGRQVGSVFGLNVQERARELQVQADGSVCYGRFRGNEISVGDLTVRCNQVFFVEVGSQQFVHYVLVELEHAV